ncbi:hypothetical protein [Nonomuraea helvata]|uniref:Uncharacterized protein n=1 Tax=Nonomuraea helvata TaxID=37484 RepID=A0ABV5RQT4_9ACTN
MSAIVLALGLAGAGVTPFIVQSASASVSAYDPVDPCDAGEFCDTTPETTVTVTETAGSPEPEQPETTITKTVTSTPKKPTKTPTPKKTTSAPAPATTPPTLPTQNLQPLPTQSAEVPETTPAPRTSDEASVDMPQVAPIETATTATATPTPTDTQPASSSEEVPLELRNAAPEFDQKSLAQKLSIPALVLVLLALFAVLIFEGRLRRMAHAAAVRKAGPQPVRPDMPPAGGYPAGPGYYTTAGFPAPGYPGGTAYAPIISFVPVQTYPAGPVPPVYEEPQYPPQGYAQEAAAEPVVLHPDEFDSFSHEPPKAKDYRDPFEPLVPPVQPPADIPPGGSGPYENEGQERPLGPASAAETGDSEPWQGQSMFEPPASRQQEYEPPPYLAPDADATAVQPLPQAPEEPAQGSEPTKEMPDPKRRRWGRKK